MSQTYQPNNPEQEQGHLAGPGFAGGAGYPGGYSWAGYGSEPPPPPPRRNHKRGLIVTGAVALAAGATAGGLIGSWQGLTASAVSGASWARVSAGQFAPRVCPAL